MEKKSATRKRSKKDEQVAEELSDSEKEITEEEEAKKESHKPPLSPKIASSPTRKKKKEKKEKATSESQPKPKEDGAASPTTTPLSPRKTSQNSNKEDKAEILSPRSNVNAGEPGFTRKRSDTMLSDFEEVLDVADEEGLTDDQVYITKVMRGIRKGAMYGETLGKLHREEKELATMKEEDREAAGVEGYIRRDYKDKVMFKFNSPTPAGSRIPLMKKDKIVMMTDYAPKIFFDIRRKCNVPTEDYLRAWTFPKENLPSPNLGAGRSGSLFVSSSDSRFIFKTIPDFEVETLLEILPSLHQHFVEHPDSRIIRFLGLHHFYDTITKEETHCIVMNNLLLHPTYGIDEKWDLKGRIPKPGKLGRFADKVDRSQKVLKDNDLLDRRFHLTEEVRDHLLKTLNSDVEFLMTHNCMDYSLLVGVHFLKDAESEAEEQESGEQKAKEEKKGKKGKKGKKKSRKNAEEKEREAEREEEEEELEPALLEGVMGPLHSDPAFKKEIYFVGIIDPLSRYKLRKKVAHFLKEIIWDADTLSTVPADYYAERYSKYLAEIFVHRKPEDVAAAAAVPAAGGSPAEGKVEEKEREAKPEGEEVKETPPVAVVVTKKGTLKREKKNKKDKVDEKEKEEVAVAVTDKEAVAASPKEDSEVVTPAVDAAPAAVAAVGQEVEIKIEEAPKKDGTLKRKKKAKKANEEAAAAAENGNAESVGATTTTTTTTVGGEQAVVGQEVEIKIEEAPKKDGTLKREKKNKKKNKNKD